MDPTPGTVRVLVVDDEQKIADTLSMILQLHGYTTRVAYSGIDALALAREFHPHVLISDVMMPSMDGIELSIRFQETFPGCKILLVSGNTRTAALLAESERVGRTFTILAKPFHPSEILAFLDGCGSA